MGKITAANDVFNNDCLQGTFRKVQVYHQYHGKLLKCDKSSCFRKKKKKVVIRIIVEISTVIELIKIQNVKVRKDSKSFSVISLRKRLPGSRSRCSTH